MPSLDSTWSEPGNWLDKALDYRLILQVGFTRVVLIDCAHSAGFARTVGLLLGLRTSKGRPWPRGLTTTLRLNVFDFVEIRSITLFYGHQKKLTIITFVICCVFHVFLLVWISTTSALVGPANGDVISAVLLSRCHYSISAISGRNLQPVSVLRQFLPFILKERSFAEIILPC